MLPKLCFKIVLRNLPFLVKLQNVKKQQNTKLAFVYEKRNKHYDAATTRFVLTCLDFSTGYLSCFTKMNLYQLPLSNLTSNKYYKTNKEPKLQ